MAASSSPGPIEDERLPILHRPLIRFDEAILNVSYGVSKAREILALSDRDGVVAAIIPGDEFLRLKRAAGEPL